MNEIADDQPVPGLPACVAVRRLTLTDFRNYAACDLAVDPAPVVLTGPNGAGKTNLLEAISLLAPGRGLRGAPLFECARHGGAGGWAVAAEVEGALGSVRLGTGLLPEAGEPAQRQCRIDGARIKGPGAFADHLRLVWLTPALDRLWAGPASERRRFLDRLAATFDPGHGGRLGAFEEAMRERNRLLAEGRRAPAWLDALEARMAAEAVAVAAGRRELIARLTAEIEAASNGFPPAHLAVLGTLEDALAEDPAVEAEDAYRAALAAARARDAAAGRALEGPHRSDLLAWHGPTGAEAARCSTGEQKALLISVTLAQAALARTAFGGVAPLVLLDEIAAHLDAVRRDALFGALAELGVQAWLTGTDERLFESLRELAQFCAVKGGEIRS